MKTIAWPDQPMPVPTKIAVCPICGAQVEIEICEITQDYDGTWRASEFGGFTSTCSSEPDITDDHYDQWLARHFVTPYIDWLPIDQKIAAWLDDNYRFEAS